LSSIHILNNHAPVQACTMRTARRARGFNTFRTEVVGCSATPTPAPHLTGTGVQAEFTMPLRVSFPLPISICDATLASQASAAHAQGCISHGSAFLSGCVIAVTVRRNMLSSLSLVAANMLSSLGRSVSLRRICCPHSVAQSRCGEYAVLTRSRCDGAVLGCAYAACAAHGRLRKWQHMPFAHTPDVPLCSTQRS